MNPTVIILGGGVAGLSAAHELIERGFHVEIYESTEMAGGKARSVGLPGSGKDGRRDLPGEHGFRFFPRFYRHITDAMARIPLRGGRTVADNLVETSRCQLARYDRLLFDFPARFPRNLSDLRLLLHDLGRIFGGDLDITEAEFAFFGSKVWQIVTSCRERRVDEYEKIAWWDFIEAERHSIPYQKLLAQGITRSLVAAKAREASAKTIGDIFVQLVFDIITPGPSSDHVLNGPTNDVWIDPWLEYLRSKGLKYTFGAKAVGVTFDGERIVNARVMKDGGEATVTGDHFILALPAEDVIDLITPEMIKVEPALGHLFTIDDITEWMNGIQFFLTEDVPIVHGHTILIDTPWALTAISQPQFWTEVDLRQFGDGAVRGIISVDISDWEEPGHNGKTAMECSREEIKDEVWDQLKRSFNHGDEPLLRDEMLHSWSLDPSITVPPRAEGSTTNEEPLLVNLVDTWRLRPEAVTRIPNLFLASDYVRTNTDLATMEAANEAARRAVNGLLRASGSSARECSIWQLHEPEMLAPWREIDRVRYEMGLPWDDTLVRLGLSVAELAEDWLMALEGDSARYDPFTGSVTPVDMLQNEVVSLFQRSHDSTTSEMRGDAVELVEQVVQLAARHLAEIQSSVGARRAGGESPSKHTASSGKVSIGVR